MPLPKTEVGLTPMPSSFSSRTIVYKGMLTAPQLPRYFTDLRDPRVLREELAIGKIRAQHKKSIAALHRAIARREPEKAGHPDIERIVEFEMLFAAECVHNWGL